MPQPDVTWFVEIAGEAESLTDAPSNWQALVMDGETPDQFFFCGEDTSSTLLRAVSIPVDGENIIPELWVTQQILGSSDLIEIPNYGNSGVSGRYVLAVRYSEPATGTATLIGRSRFEAWDSYEDLRVHEEPENEIMIGTDGNNSRSMLRAIDVTREVVNPGTDPDVPAAWWWSSSVEGGEDVEIYNKLLHGSASYLSSDLFIVPSGTEWSGSEFAPGEGEVASIWYIALAAVIPHDAMVSMAEHRYIFNVRNFFE